ncbi:pisatin demethylase [Exophiala viscosa]|uniref:pisatin demethylase n=1 Tax=Exophiala viscosa TaxID=2486360 RepID=UPI002194345E|nr:pisatin demethylase [Exophiala viscosa]
MGIVYLAVIGLSCYFAMLMIYRIYFHPLSKYPGPLINKFCPVPTIISLLNGRMGMDVKTLHDKYGPVVRIAPTELSFNGVQAWDDIYGYRHGKTNMPKDPVHAGAVQSIQGVVSMQYEPDEATHARQKRGLAYSFSQKALNEQESIINSHIHKFTDKVAEFSEQGRIFNLADWYNFLTFDAIGDLAFKEYYGCLDDGKYHYWVTLVFKAVKAGALVQATRRFATAGTPLQKLLLRAFGDIFAPNKEHMKLTRAQVKKRLENTNDDHRDFLWYILKQQDKFELREEEIITNSALFILAGSETTANSLSGLTARLLRDRRAYDKLVQEIRSEFSSEEDISHDRTMRMSYLNACINEGLRVHPPITPGLLRSVPDGGAIIDGYDVPSGTTVSVSSWAASHNPANFVQPDEFIPERWLEEAYSTDHKRATQPFSLGPRVCLGKNLAWMEIRLALVRLLWKFDIEAVDGANLWDPDGQMKHMKAYMVWAVPELSVKATPAKR